MWDRLRAPLAAAGETTADVDVTRDDSIDAMARRGWDTVDGRAVLVGFSMGGMVALRMHALAPDRVAGMVLIDTNAAPDLPERSAARIRQQARVGAGCLMDVVLNELMPSYFAPANRARPDLRRLVRDMAEAAGPEVFVRQSEAIRLRPDSRMLLATIHCPVLIVAGNEDRLCPPDWQRSLAASLVAAEFELVAGAGHFMPLEDPAHLLSAVLGWAENNRLG